MKWFTVEVTVKPVTDDDWTAHLRAVDAVPGTLLIQDADCPILSFPVEASEPFKAARFVEGVLSILDLEAVSGEITDLPELDVELEADDETEVQRPPSDVVRGVQEWMADTPAAPSPDSVMA